MSSLGLDPATIQIPQPGADQGAPSPSGAGGGSEDDPVAALKAAIDAMNQYAQAEPDAVDRAAGAKILAQLHALVAKDQQDKDQAGSATLNPRLLRKAGAIQ